MTYVLFSTVLSSNIFKGHWDHTVHAKTYSSQVAIHGMKGMAGYTKNEDYYLPRNRIEPPTELEKQIFPWVDAELVKLEEKFAADSDDPKATAWGFLRFLRSMRRVILQDAAAMIVEDPGRRNQHPFFQLELFHSDSFEAFVGRMRNLLMESSVQAEARGQIEKALRGMNARFDNLESRVQGGYSMVASRLEELVRAQLDNFRVSIAATVADQLIVAADSIRATGGDRESNGGEQGGSGVEELEASGLDDPSYFGHKLTTGFCGSDSVFRMYNEWHGLREFTGIPVDGGIAAIEAAHGSNWRKVGKYWTAKEQKHFSRMGIIMRGIDCAVAEGHNFADVCQELTQHFTHGGSKSLAGLAIYVQEKGWVERKRRRVETDN
jgi:hypothetical protein